MKQLFTIILFTLSVQFQSGYSDQLLFVIDISKYGSSTPKYQNVVNATGVYYPQGLGQLTPMGMRQQYIRGREMRRRYIENTQFLSQSVDLEEIYAMAVDKERAYMSAMNFFMGLYPPGTTNNPMTSNQSQVAVPPYNVNDCDIIQGKLGNYALENNFQTIPIHSDAQDYSDLMFRAYDREYCPIMKEIQDYELANNTEIAELFRYHNETMLKWVLQKFGGNISHSQKMTPEFYRYIFEEVECNNYEQKFVKYSLTSDQQQQIKNFTLDYFYKHWYGNDTAVQITTTDLFKFIVTTLDNKAKQTFLTDNSTSYLRKLKYWHAAVRGLQFPAYLKYMNVSSEYMIYHQPTSSFIFEFYLNSTATIDSFSRSNYYVKIYQNDQPLNLSTNGVVECDEDFRCSWSSVAAFFESRYLMGKSVADICFSHLDLGNDQIVIDGNMPWWLAILIAVPCVIVSVIIIKCGIVVREKRKLKNKQLQDQRAKHNSKSKDKQKLLLDDMQKQHQVHSHTKHPNRKASPQKV